jgi:hypothetical protein
MLGLAADRPVPIETEPGKVLDNGGLTFGPTAGMVDILDAQQKTTARLARGAPTFERGADMPQMQIPGRARRKPGDDAGSSKIENDRELPFHSRGGGWFLHGFDPKRLHLGLEHGGVFEHG